MKINKYFKYYGISWVLSLILFHVIAFVTPHEIGGINRLEKPAFWIGYALLLLALIGQLICSYLFLRDDKKEKIFLRFAVLRVGAVSLAVSVLIGAVFFLLPKLPAWAASVIALLALVFYICGGLRAVAAEEAVTEIGERGDGKTSFIHTITAEAKALTGYATPATEDAANRVYEALRYSVPASKTETADIETEIFDVFAAFSENVKNGEEEPANEAARRLVSLIEERNAKSRLSH